MAADPTTPKWVSSGAPLWQLVHSVGAQRGQTAMRLKAVICMVLMALGWRVEPASATERVALIIGNANYAAAGRLSNPPNDTRIVGEALHRNAFEVIPVQDASLAQFRAALREFRTKAAGAEIAMVYYAGHGIEANGRNWLIPVDAKLESDFDLADEAIDLDRVMEALAGAKVRIVVLDACRNNPFGRSWSSKSRAVVRGLAPVEIDDILVIYAAGPGQVAQDGDGGNSPFAQSLATRLVEPNLPLQLLGGAVRDDVMAATGRAQRPFVSASMTGTPIYLGPGAGPSSSTRVELVVPPTGSRPTPARAEVTVQASPKLIVPASNSTDPAVLTTECEQQSNLWSCNALGNFYAAGRVGLKKDRIRAASYYQRSCDGGNTIGCANMGASYEDGMFTPKDRVRASEYYRTACAGGHGMSCWGLGSLHERGSGVPKDDAEALQYYRKAAAIGLGDIFQPIVEKQIKKLSRAQ